MNITSFELIYSAFLSKVTDDMYADTWTEQDVLNDLENILIAAIPRFRYPRFPIFDYVKRIYDEENVVIKEGFFNAILSPDEIQILSDLMICEWMVRQIATTENTRQSVYSSSDFKQSSQANHMDKLTKLHKHFLAEAKLSQDLYGRRKQDEKGYMRPNFSRLGGGTFDN